MDYPNTGALFRTKEKKHEKSPDMFGSLKIDKHYLLSLIEESNGQLIEVKFSGWTSVSSAGVKYLSLKLNTMQQQTKKEEDDDQEIPF
jgi:hypothetical protein